MRTRLIFALLFCLSVSGFAQKSSIDFEIKNLGITVDGHFNTFTITTAFNEDGILEKLSGKINVSSIETGIDSRDEHILKEDYFNADKFQFITLQSTSITKKSDSKFSVKASLTIKGKTKIITIPVSVTKTSKNYKVTSSFEINRRDFDVGGGSFVMSKTVKINVVHYQNI